MKIIDMMKAAFITMLFLVGLVLLPFVSIFVGCAFVFSLSYVIMREVRLEKKRARDRLKCEQAQEEGRERVELKVVK